MISTLTARDVTIDLGGRPVVNAVNLTVAAGEFVTVLGTNGSGKSTLIRACVGLIPVRSGSIDLFGTALPRFHDWRRIGYVPQRSSAVSGVPATVQEVVMSGRLARRRFFGGPNAADRKAVEMSLGEVGLADRWHSSVNQLSGGQQQRVFIARAIAAQPDLLVMDEPTAGVDHDNQQALAGLLRRLIRRGTSVLLVEHDVGALQHLIDRAVVLKGGVVAYDGSPEGLTGAEDPQMHTHTAVPAPAATLSGEGIWR